MVLVVNKERSDHICEYHSAHKIRIFSLNGVKWLAINMGEKILIVTQCLLNRQIFQLNM